MLHPALHKHIQFPEYCLLYHTRMRLSAPALNKDLQNHIKQIRQKYSSKNRMDLYEEKARKFPKTGDWAKSEIIKLEKVIFDINKTVPQTDQGQWRSIEFELVFENENLMNQFVREMRTKGYTKYVTIKTDGSLRADEDDRNGAVPKEVVVSYRSGNEQIVRDVCAALKGRAYVNNSCGTHVHFDMRGSNAATAKQFGKRLARYVPALRCLLPKSRRTNKHCLNTINDFHDGERYSFVNLQAYEKYQTIEVRGHSATLRADKILNWIALCEKIMNTRARAKDEEITDPRKLIDIYHLDTNLAAYINERYSKFNAVDKVAAVIPPAVNAPAAPF